MNTPYAEAATLRNATLNDLATVLKDQRGRALDVVAPAPTIRATDGQLRIAGTEAQLDDDGVTPTAGTYRLTRSAEAQLADRLGIPAHYMRRMREQRLDLWDGNVNGWLSHDPAAKHLIRVLRGDGGGEEPRCPSCGEPFALLESGAVGHSGDERGNDCDPRWRPCDGIVRAVLSDRYRVIDNLDVLLAALSGIGESAADVQVRQCDLTEKKMYVKVWSPQVAAMAPQLLAGYRSPFDGGAVRFDGGNGGWDLDAARAAAAAEGLGFEPGAEPVVFAGFVISNSETGDGRYTIAPQIVVKVCGNGLTLTGDAIAKTHLGGRLEEGVIEWSDDTQAKNLALVKAQTRDAVAQFLSVGYVEAKVAELAEQAQAPVDKDTVTLVAKRLQFSDREADSILEHWLLGGQRTAGGVMQAVSSVAQTVPDGDLAAELEARAVPALAIAAEAGRSS